MLVCENGICSAQAVAFLDSQGLTSACTMSICIGYIVLTAATARV